MKAFIENMAKSTVREKAAIILFASLFVVAGGVSMYFFITKVLPWIVLIAIFVWPFIKDHNQKQRIQQQRIQQEEQQYFMDIYREVSRLILPILMEYKVALGISPTTMNSIYSDEKYTRINEIDEPVLIYTIEKKAPSTIEISDLQSLIQKRFGQEGLGLYLARIDQRDSQFLKFYIIPIKSKNAQNWALADMRNQFSSTRPQRPGDRRDKDF